MPVPSDRPDRAGLLERDGELDSLRRSLGDAHGGAGSLIFLEGAAGLGKSSVLAALAGLAREEKIPVLAAQAREQETEFTFGIALQLFEPLLAKASEAERGRLLADAASLALPLLEPSGAVGGDAVGPAASAFPVIHGLHWLASNAARPTSWPS